MERHLAPLTVAWLAIVLEAQAESDPQVFPHQSTRPASAGLALLGVYSKGPLGLAAQWVVTSQTGSLLGLGPQMHRLGPLVTHLGSRHSFVPVFDVLWQVLLLPAKGGTPIGTSGRPAGSKYLWDRVPRTRL